MGEPGGARGPNQNTHLRIPQAHFLVKALEQHSQCEAKAAGASWKAGLNMR